jgi:glycosyltransferase involved in cell wall biosynthesis
LAEETGLAEESRAALYRSERENLRFARHVLVPSPHTAQLLENTYGVDVSDITIARPGTDRPRLSPAPADPPLILSVGIQVPRKGHDILIKALSELQDLAWQAVIVGAPLDPEYGATLRTLCDEAGLSQRVTLAGRVEQDVLEQFYASASVFALATRYEGYGIVFDEALAHGLPILSCQTGAVPDTVPPDAGILVPPDRPAAFAAALRQVLTDASAKDRCAAAARAAGAALPTWADTAKTFSGVLDTLHATSDE